MQYKMCNVVRGVWASVTKEWVRISHFVGKSLAEKYVTISPRHRKFKMLFVFESKDEAKEYYIGLNYEKEKMYLKRIKSFFCKHEEECDLDVGSKMYHYRYCPGCSRAIFVDDETEEDKTKWREEFQRKIVEEDIRELEEEIRHMEKVLAKKKEAASKIKKGENEYG